MPFALISSNVSSSVFFTITDIKEHSGDVLKNVESLFGSANIFFTFHQSNAFNDFVVSRPPLQSNFCQRVCHS